MSLKKNKTILFRIIIILIYLLISFIGFTKIRKSGNETSDALQINRISSLILENWNDLSAGDYSKFDYPFAVLDTNENLIFSYLDPETVTLQEMMRRSDVALPILKDGQMVGTVIIETHTIRDLQEQNARKQYVIIMCTILFLSLMIMLVYDLYLSRNILTPFHQLSDFSRKMALGDYNTPLHVKGNKIFLPLVQALDIMRDELKSAKKREYEANQSKKALVASLSHDIKTPITSIQLAVEVLDIKVTDPALKDSLHAIMNKTAQIDHLVTDLFHTTMEDMEALPVSLKEVYSTDLIQLIHEADINHNVRNLSIPECMIRIDSMRIEQVFTNIIYNSYKYANTDIDITGEIQKDYLQLTIQDYGPGIDSEELPCIFNRFYRGSNVGEQSGSGLGLYICKCLIEKMDGEIYCDNNHSSQTQTNKGFAIVLKLSLV